MINVSPTLFVGFGGSGSKALHEIKDSLKDVLKRSFPGTPGALRDDYIPPCFQFLEVDTDQTDAPRFEFDSHNDDFLNCDPGESLEKLDARIKKADGDLAYIKRWWPKGLGKAISQKNRDQAMREGYRLRQFGKLALWLKAKDFRDRVTKCELDCTSADASIEVANMYAGGLDVQGALEVYVVASIAGGTGCGMIIDGLFMLHNILKEKFYSRTYLLLPSVYSKAITSGNTEPLVNAYAALKEYDHFNHGNAAYTAEISRRHSITSPEFISNRTYILGGRTEGNMTFDGYGFDVSKKTARLIVNSVFGFSEEEYQWVQKERRGLTGKEVSAFYLSPGVHELRYPNKEIKKFIQTYTKQLLAAYLRKSDRLAEYTSKYAPKGDIVSCAEEYANQDTLKRCLTIQRPPVPFLSLEPEVFLDKKTAAANIDNQFAAAKREVDRFYASDKKWNDMKKDILTDAKNWLYNCIGNIFADFKNGGVDAVDLFLAKVEKMTTCPSVEPLTPLSDESYRKLKHYFVQNFPGFFSFGETRCAHIDQFLHLLKHDINARIDFHVRSREKEIADAIREIVMDCRLEWIQIVKNLEDICSSCYCETQETAKMMGEQVDQLNWVGCSPGEIADLKEKIRYYAVKDCLILAGELKSIIEEHSDVRNPMGPEARLKEIEDKTKVIEERIDAHAQNILNRKYIHDESISIVDRVIDYVREYRPPAGADPKEAVQSYLVKNVMLLSQPLNTITAPSAGSILQKDLIVSLPQDDIVRLRNEISSDIDICIRSLGYMDPHSMLFVQTRRELSTDEIRDIHDYYEAYCDCNKNPAPSKYSGINLTAHLFDDSTWKEIVHVDVTADDVKNYIKLGQKMKVIVQYGKGKTSYWVFVDPVNLSASEKPDEQYVFGGPFVEEAKIMDALLKDSALLDELKNMLIETMCGTFEHGLQGQLKYLYFKDALQNPKSKGKKDPKIDIPDDIESAVANNMGWNL